VAAFIREDSGFEPFWQRMTALLDPLLPRYAAEGKKYLTVALGCTGGQHRSVLLAELLAARLAEQGWRVDLTHRELDQRERALAGARAAQAADQTTTGLAATSQATHEQLRDSGKDPAGAGDGSATPTSPPGREAPSTCTL
jgi:UPF0042 nucleotide-binding protein